MGQSQTHTAQSRPDAHGTVTDSHCPEPSGRPWDSHRFTLPRAVRTPMGQSLTHTAQSRPDAHGTANFHAQRRPDAHGTVCHTFGTAVDGHGNADGYGPDASGTQQALGVTSG